MNYEEKYKQALERARKELQELKNKDCDDTTRRTAINIIRNLFPELVESKDERIRKMLRAYIHDFGVPKEYFGDVETPDVLAWLDKQGKKDPCIDCTNDKGCVTCENGNLKEIKAEPKFKVGDWVVFPMGIIGRIDTLDDVNYQVTTTDGYNFDYKISKQHFYHLWSIKDAKDGDVLVDVYGNIGIYKSHDDFDWASYCSLGCNGGFQNFKVEHENENTHPATKEQRDLLFEKMKEDGYKLDAEKKELKKIEHKMLNADKVIAWIDEHVPTKFEDMANYVQQFKEDFGL